MTETIMQHRPIGNTGMSASVIGLGTEHLDNKPYHVVEEVIGVALEHGINIFDLFMPGTPVRENIGKALKGKRDKVLIQGHIGSVDLKQQYDISRDVPTCRKYFEELLRCLDTDYIDLGMMFFVDTEKDFDDVFNTGYIDYVRQLKQAGTIRAVGASSHSPDIAMRLVETGEVEHLMFSVNLAYDMLPASMYIVDSLMSDEKIDRNVFRGIDPKRARLYELCASRDVSITTMKTLGAGKLLSADQTPFAVPMTVAQCIHYALSRPAVVSTLIGCKDRAEVLEAVGYLHRSDVQRDYTGVAETLRETFQGKCVYCNHCQPCPAEIDIAAATKYLEIALLDERNIPFGTTAHYNNLPHQASECTECGSCESRCPFNVAVVQNMRRAAAVFGK